MRKAPKSEQEKLEIEAAERTDRRKGGFELGKVRDRGWGTLHDITGREVVMLWHPVERLPGLAYDKVPDNHFGLVIDGKKVIFEAEEFRRLLRWV